MVQTGGFDLPIGGPGGIVAVALLVLVILAAFWLFRDQLT